MPSTMLMEETASLDTAQSERWLVVLHHVIGHKRHEAIGPFSSEEAATSWRDHWITHPDTEIIPMYDPLDTEMYLMRKG